MPSNRNECALKANPQCFWERVKPEWEELDGLFENNNISVSDVDGEINIRNDFVRIEWKLDNQPLTTGQRISLERWSYRMRAPSIAMVVQGNPRQMRPNRLRICVNGARLDWEETDLADFKRRLKSFEAAALKESWLPYPRNTW